MVSYLRFYARKDIQKEILKGAKNREVAFKFGDKGFGKRPDILQFEGDVFEMAKQGVTSFHFSEERWENPLDLNTGMTKKQLDELRIGWDLILDIDGPFELSRITTELLIESLKFHNIENLTVKFSGNKGFHLAIPFESFPEKIHNENKKDLFPEGPRKIANYLKYCLHDTKEKRFFLRNKILEKYSEEEILKMSGKPREEIYEKICKKCGSVANDKVILIYECECGRSEEGYTGRSLECPQCKRQRRIIKKRVLECSSDKNHTDFESADEFNPFSVVDIDTILISSRHMFRAPYSINEKSGLVSVPLNPEDVINFERSDAEPEKVKVNSVFLNSESMPDASQLIKKAYDWDYEQAIKKNESIISSKEFNPKKEFDIPSVAIKADYFPPCILKIMEGINEDGRKRSLFILLNFLKSCGWNMDEIKDFVCNKWNKNNYEPLKEGYVLSQISWHRKQSKNILPPNCDNKSYYNDLRLCSKDGLCGKVKNPVNYAIKKSRLFNKTKKTVSKR